MAKIIRCEWTSNGPLGKHVRHVAFKYTLTIHGTRERKVSSAWPSEQDTLKALSDRKQQLQAWKCFHTAGQVRLGQGANGF